jgi:hypothetical protein
MIDKLKWAIDQCEDKPKLKEILLEIAKLKEDKQELMLSLIESGIFT